MKLSFNNGDEPNLTFWRDSNGNEVDLIETVDNINKAIEIKSGQTYSADYFKGLKKWQEISHTPVENCCVVYAGEIARITQYGNLVPFKGM